MVAPQGHPIIEQGSKGDEMFVILQGSFIIEKTH